jgi:hypothetical protein
MLEKVAMRTVPPSPPPEQIACKVGHWYAQADAAHARGIAAYLDFSRACAELVAAGETQRAIASRYHLSRPAIAQAVCVGRDPRLVSSANTLPRSTYALYLLTTLPDEAFARFAQPDTTREELLQHKRRTAAAAVPRPEPMAAAPESTDPVDRAAVMGVEIGTVLYGTLRQIVDTEALDAKETAATIKALSKDAARQWPGAAPLVELCVVEVLQRFVEQVAAQLFPSSDPQALTLTAAPETVKLLMEACLLGYAERSEQVRGLA